MKITIDTKSDTQDEIIRAIELLRTFTNESNYNDDVRVEAKDVNVKIDAKEVDLQHESTNNSNLNFLNGFSSKPVESNVSNSLQSVEVPSASESVGVTNVVRESKEQVVSNESANVNMDFLNMDMSQPKDNLVVNSNVENVSTYSQVNDVVSNNNTESSHPENQSTHINMQNNASYSDTTSFNDINKAIEMKFKRDQDQGSAPDFSSFLNLAKKAQEAKDKEKKDDVKIEFF